MTDHNREEREALIEKAAKAIIDAKHPVIGWGTLSEEARERRRKQARAALEVFEQAHAPTSGHHVDQSEDAEPQAEPTDAQLDALYDTFMAHSRGEEFNELGEKVCSECGEAFAWPDGNGGYAVPNRRRQRHFARAALRASLKAGGGGQ